MNPNMARRIQGTAPQQTAQQLRTLATYSLHLQRNTKLNAEQRFQALRRLATR